MTSEVQPAADYWTDDFKMTSKVQPAADYWTDDFKMTSKVLSPLQIIEPLTEKGKEIVLFLVSRKTKSEMAKLLEKRGNILNE